MEIVQRIFTLQLKIIVNEANGLGFFSDIEERRAGSESSSVNPNQFEWRRFFKDEN